MNKNTALYNNLVSCHVCNRLNSVSLKRCSRCDSLLHKRIKNSIQETLAFLLLAVILYIPANMFPIMATSTLGSVEESTILGGVITFIEMESYFVAFVIFVASVLIPVVKIVSILWLCLSVVKREKLKKYELTKLYRVTEFIGKWSMVDIFVVGVLVALIKIENIVSINSGIAANAFTGVVICTMIAAHRFDVRLIWDKMD